MGAFATLLFALLTLVALQLSEGAAILQDDDEWGPDYLAHFHVDAASVVIHVLVKTTGYVGFGISPTGEMHGADIFIGGVRGGTAYYGDYHGVGHTPVLDTIENWEFVQATENATHTEIELRRLFDTKDTAHDLEGPITVIWSYGATDDIAVPHVAKGAKIITIRPKTSADCTEQDDYTFIPDPVCCKSFYQCYSQQAHLLQCPEYFHFNTLSKRCEPIELVGCKRVYNH